MQKKILITGATGFIGQHLLEELKGEDFSLRIISRSSSPQFWCSNMNFERCVADLSDLSSLEPVFEGIDIVVNLAAELNDENKMFSTNTIGVQNIIELALKYGVQKIIQISTESVVGVKYSRKTIVVDETFPCNPVNEYARTKLQAEMLLSEAAINGNVTSIILRPTHVFGDYHPQNYILELFKRIKSEIAIPRLKNTTVNYIYVKDVAHAIRFFLNNSIKSQVVNIADDLTFSDFLRIASNALGVTCSVRNVPGFIFAVLEIFKYFGQENIRARFQSVSNCVEYSNQFMKNIIGYKHGVEAGIRKTIDYYGL